MSSDEMPLPDTNSGPVEIHTGDGYDAARVLLLDPGEVGDLLVAMPERDTLYLGREADMASLESLLRLTAEERVEHPVSTKLYRLEGERLVSVSAVDDFAVEDRTV